jgi:hypothetical protein
MGAYPIPLTPIEPAIGFNPNFITRAPSVFTVEALGAVLTDYRVKDESGNTIFNVQHEQTGEYLGGKVKKITARSGEIAQETYGEFF